MIKNAAVDLKLILDGIFDQFCLTFIGETSLQ